MPFTPAHAVVALPFVGTRLVPAAIAIGSMTPDVPLFFKFGPSYDLTHSWLGILVVDIPLALVLLIVWRVVLRPAVPELTPRWFSVRWPLSWRDPASGWRELWRGASATLLLIGSLAIGAVTHLVWDAFTHEDRWGSVLIPQLDAQVGPFRLYAWGHYVSSVVGLVIIAVWGIRWMRRQTPHDRAYLSPGWLRVVAWVALPVCLALGSVLVAALRGGPDAEGLRIFVERSGTTAAALFLVALAVISLFARKTTGINRREPA